MAAVDDLFTCAICLDVFESPRRLPCHHVYCQQCLRGLVNKEKNRITCPECRRKHVVPNKRVDEFPVDGRLTQIIETFEKLKPGLNEDWKNSSALSECKCCQPSCLDCSTNRALLLESLLQESRHFRADFLTEKQKITKQNLRSLLLQREENLGNLRIKIVSEIEAIVEQFEVRKLTLLSAIEKEQQLIVEDLSKLDQADAISAEHESLLADLVDKVPPPEALVSLRKKLSDQKELMTSLHKIGQNATVLFVSFNSDELRKMIDSYGELFTAVDYQKDFTINTTLDGSESGAKFKQPWVSGNEFRLTRILSTFIGLPVSESGNLFSRPSGLTVCPITDNVYVTDYRARAADVTIPRDFAYPPCWLAEVNESFTFLY